MNKRKHLASNAAPYYGKYKILKVTHQFAKYKEERVGLRPEGLKTQCALNVEEY